MASYPTYSVAPAAAASVARSTVSTQQQIDDAWKEYTAPNGAKYYHNPLLNQSTYTKPDALSKKEPSSSTARARQWQEYEDASTGKKYYSDGATTTWEKPPGFQSPTETQEVETSEAPPKKKKKKTPLEETSYSSKEEAIAGFKGLLLVKGIAPVQKWNEVAKYCSSDARWESFAEILSVGERRQALAEYQTKRANELKNQERQERIRAKEAFGQLLTDVLQTVSGFSALNSRFSDIRASLAKDDRFHAVADEGSRESLFLDFCEELRKREERKKRNKKRESQEAFISFLSEKEEAGTLTFASSW
jgi:pre-mRNA-processing factor 40